MRSDYQFWIPVETRFRDMDAMGHVNSSVYFTYFEMCRMRYFDAVGLHDYKEVGVVGPAVVSQTCNYRQQIFHPSSLEGGIRTTKVGNKSFAVSYEFYLKGTDTLMCDGETAMCWVDYVNAKSIPLPDALREAIKAFDAPVK